ncbi:glycoside hydrolase family 35 protein [Tulasnella calospora MUT 4182]|uniref:Beta-galactosidase n=1 Tax=Tulasnella calospora MUT 4182 TaxID=1051891 RepID=A0A0C3QCI9_9AGAM|nr:glycoside hydrolase family 35 protein [Tulasnella calospora MUT 4182]
MKLILGYIISSVIACAAGTVTWDGYSLSINDQRIFLWSGEFHPWRLPVVHKWRDVLVKVKAAGMNAISVYIHWGLTNPAPGVFDFNEYRALEPLFKMAMEIGIWIVLRPGPYINAETTAGGIPHWVTSHVSGHLRTNDTAYYNAWRPYIDKVAELAAPHQITRGGPIIAVQLENEYVDRDDVGYPGKREMMEELKAAIRSGGIEVPLTINDAYMGANYVNGTGSGDIYGFDSYPQGFDCAHPGHWQPVIETYAKFHKHANPHQPLYIPEFQGGAYDAWPGYEACATLTNGEFESVFHLALLASNAKMINIYMIYGGTSWGHLPFPGVYTSYDYGAAISENRDIRVEKYAEIKRQGLFLRSVPDFYKTDIMPDTTWEISPTPGSSPVAATLLQNSDTNSSFLIARHQDSTLSGSSSFHLRIHANSHVRAQWQIAGELQIPQIANSIQLEGRQSKIVTTFLASPPAVEPRRNTLLYSTAAILYFGWMGGREVLVLTGHGNQEHEFAVFLQTSVMAAVHPFLNMSPCPTSSLYTIFHVLPGLTGLVPIHESKNQAIYFVDTATSRTFWAPMLEVMEPKTPPFQTFWSVGSNSSIIISGPALVRSASFHPHLHQLSITGDLDPSASVYLTIIGMPLTTKSIHWNGQEIIPLKSLSVDANFRAMFHLVPNPALLNSDHWPQQLDNWEYANSLPEASFHYDDSNWVRANHTSTNLSQKPYCGKHVLYGCDYGFCEGVVIWRGHFVSSPKIDGVTLTINGGQGFAASVYVNDVFIRTTYGNSTSNKNIISETTEWYSFPNGVLTEGENVLTIVQDNMGLDETRNHWDTDGSRSPRGIRGYDLHNGDFTYWKVQGKSGGFNNYPDRKRGIFNEGGLYGERMGWHRPEVPKDGQEWTTRSLTQGLTGGYSGIGFFRTHFQLKLFPGRDVMQSFHFVDCTSMTPTLQPYRAWIFVNGWMMGKRVANLGPQTRFPVHEGILVNGTNLVVIAVWGMDATVAPCFKLELATDRVYDQS